MSDKRGRGSWQISDFFMTRGGGGVDQRVELDLPDLVSEWVALEGIEDDPVEGLEQHLEQKMAFY